MKRKIIVVAIALMLLGIHANAQLQVDKQIEEISPVISAYVDGYMNDLSAYQGISYLNAVSTTAKVLPQWAVGLSLRMGAGVATPNVFKLPQSPNIEQTGMSPSLFSDADPGSMQFFLIDPDEGYRIIHPFTGEYIGFEMDLLEGAGLGTAVSPSVMPTLTLGVGFGTEISAGILPGAIKASVSDMGDELSIDKDLAYTLGIRHDVFQWVPALNKRDFHLTVGVSYAAVNIEVGAAEDEVFTISNTSSDYFSVENGLTGLEYSTKATGFEVMLGKSFGWVDLSVFASTNKNKYTIESVGDLKFRYAEDYYADNIVYEDAIVDNVVDVSQSVKRTLLGAALQLNLGRFNISGKYAVSDEDYYSVGLGFVFGKYKGKTIKEE